jgi:DNA-binding transcriptional regulator YdaS (Cro superfamily)
MRPMSDLSLGRRRVAAADPGKEAVLRAAGGIKPIADALGISSAAVSKWGKIPASRVIQIEARTSVSRHVQRPDLYPQGD